MKVKELREELAALDPNAEVFCYIEDKAFNPSGGQFRLLDVEHIDTVEAEQVRLADGSPYFKIGKTAASRVFVTLNVTANF